jgi:NAD(P)-dependent dehydrogenase (short-subunit alcohol dehydrogenase family)
MRIQLRPLHQQVIVITGASSGIGLVTARRAAEKGAKLVLNARNDHDLDAAVNAIRSLGGRAVRYAGDIAEPETAERLAKVAVAEFGRIDTWVNNAAVAMYGRIMELELADMRRQFDVNFWGQVYGSRAAVNAMRHEGGALINVASALADRAIPLQGIYCAAKHALKAFSDTLRMELEEERVPISVSLVKPGSVDTPFFEKAKTLMGVEPQPVPPVYTPEVVAETILECASRPVRDVIAGGMGKMLSVADSVPRLADRYMERTTFTSQMTDTPVDGDRRDNLHEPVEHDGGERGRNWQGHVFKHSAYTTASLHKGRAALVLAGVGAVALVARALKRGDGSGRRGASAEDTPAAPPNPLPSSVDPYSNS